jgi:hypothetical protein
MTEPVPAPVHDGRRLDWFPRYDERSQLYAATPAAVALPTSGRLWNPGQVLDQGSEGACCGFAAAAEAAAEPVPVPRVTNRYARGWYLNAQRRDEWPGQSYDGTSVLATMKEGKARGLYGGYGWFFTVEQLAAGIVRDESDDGGPAVIGVEWRAGSYSTDPWGVLRPSGPIVGGHALCVLGYVPADSGPDRDLWDQLEELDLAGAVDSVLVREYGAFVVQNSWGPTFGRNGLCVVPVSVMRAWVESGGEFAQPQQRRLPAPRKGSAMTEPEDLDVEEPVVEPEPEPEPEQPATSEPTDTTLHLTAVDVQDGDRILDPPDELGQESVTVRGVPQVVQDHRGRRVVVRSTAGVFTLGAGSGVTVRRRQ